METDLPGDFYESIKSRLYERIGRAVRLAYRVLDLGCGACELARFLRETYRQRVTGVDVSERAFPGHPHRAKGRSSLRCVKADARHLGFVRDGGIDAVVPCGPSTR